MGALSCDAYLAKLLWYGKFSNWYPPHIPRMKPKLFLYRNIQNGILYRFRCRRLLIFTLQRPIFTVTDTCCSPEIIDVAVLVGLTPPAKESFARKVQKDECQTH